MLVSYWSEREIGYREDRIQRGRHKEREGDREKERKMTLVAFKQYRPKIAFFVSLFITF